MKGKLREREMNGDEEKDDFVEGTTERRINVVRIGQNVVKVTTYEEETSKDGELIRRNVEENPQLACGHAQEMGGQCTVCQRYFCQACVSAFGTCFVCGGVACPTCSESTVLDKNKKYHKACWPESIRRKIFG